MTLSQTSASSYCPVPGSAPGPLPGGLLLIWAIAPATKTSIGEHVSIAVPIVPLGCQPMLIPHCRPKSREAPAATRFHLIFRSSSSPRHDRYFRKLGFGNSTCCKRLSAQPIRTLIRFLPQSVMNIHLQTTTCEPHVRVLVSHLAGCTESGNHPCIRTPIGTVR